MSSSVWYFIGRDLAKTKGHVVGRGQISGSGSHQCQSRAAFEGRWQWHCDGSPMIVFDTAVDRVTRVLPLRSARGTLRA